VELVIFMEQTLPEAHAGSVLGQVEFTLDLCIKCNICTTACPVMAVTDRFPGPKYAAPQAGRFRMPLSPGLHSPDQSVDYCSGCRVCNMVCLTGVKIAEMNARARAALVEDGQVPLLRRLRNNLLARAATLGKFAQPVAPLANFVLGLKPARWAAEATLGIARSAPFPPFSAHKFTTWFRKHPRPAHAKRQVVYFHGCSTEYYEPRIGRAAVRVLEANGFEVIVPSQNCCGLPLLSNGEFPAARQYHTNNVRKLVGYARQGIPIVGTSTSCTLTLKEEAPELLDMHDEDTRLVAEQTYDFNEWLLQCWSAGELNTNFRPLPLKLPYHIPCQYRGHRIGKPGMALLKLIPDLQINDGHAACCGIAGTYGFKAEKYDISMAVGETLFDFVRQSGAPLAVCDSETCRWQITHASGIPAIHPVELLAAAYGFEIEGALADVLRGINGF
jgi:glycerol-3-phosphate dehydrogenase subunit C